MGRSLEQNEEEKSDVETLEKIEDRGTPYANKRKLHRRTKKKYSTKPKSASVSPGNKSETARKETDTESVVEDTERTGFFFYSYS